MTDTPITPIERRGIYFDVLAKSISAFVSYDDINYEDALADGFRAIAEAEDIGRIVVFRIWSEKTGSISEIYRWDKKLGGTAPIDEALRELPVNPTITRWYSILQEDACIRLNGGELSEDEAAFLSPYEIHSMIFVPAFVSNRFWGVVVFHDNTNERNFDAGCEQVLRSVARLCASAITRKEKTKAAVLSLGEINRSKKMKDCLNQAASIFLTCDDSASLEDLMTQGVKSIVNAIDIDRFSIWRNSATADGLYSGQIYRWDRILGGTTVPTPALTNVKYAVMAPRWEEFLSRGEVINSPSSFLPEAAMLQSFGVVSVVVVPLFFHNRFWGFTLFEDRKRERFFDVDSMDTMKSAAYLCVSTLLRSEMEAKIIASKVDQEKAAHQMVTLDAMPLACRLWNKDLEIIDCNDENLRLFGMNDKHEYMKRHFDLSPKFQPDGQRSREKKIELLRRAFEKGSCTFEWMHRKMDGTPLPVEINLVRVEYQGEYVVAGYTHDLRNMKALLNEIQDESEKFMTTAHWYESILDAIPFTVTVQDIDKNFTFINSAGEILFKKKRGDLIGKPCKVLNTSICATDECAISCAKRGTMKTYFSHNDALLQADVKILKNFNDEDTGYIEVIQDITKLEQLTRQQAEAEASNKAKSSFLSTMSHEMRTPMNAIMGMVAIGKNAAGVEKKDYAFSEIEKASAHLLDIINDLLDMSNIDKNKFELTHASFDLTEILKETDFIFRTGIDEKQLRFSINTDSNVPSFFFGDGSRLMQVLVNLLSNAIKFSREGGEISLDVSFSGEEQGICELYFAVTDTGTGISPEHQEQIFAPFNQADNSMARKHGGTGLGLVISKHIVEKMGGSMGVVSAPGKGSRFFFTVKMLRDEKKSMPVSEDEAAENIDRLAGKKLLLAEDVEINREVFIAMLENTGVMIDTAENGKEALEMVMAAPDKYDLIFMDMQMPEMNGLEATRRIRALDAPRCKTLPIIALTANTFQNNIDDCRAAGMNTHIGKPFDINIVLEKMLEYI